ncbi:hypothetical protein SLS53_003572 [Cytospora paraplurivora]|uniref:Major facilitator superfamily (MFS) profile domain-containing protein n=1 Tax=Cytospora paraplurivora TaxID=2898453 RepID=A0AAN9UCX2_9PEZI
MDGPDRAWPFWKFGLKRDDLTTTLHDRFNTVPSAIQDPEAFHHDVYELSTQACTLDEFECLMEERKNLRLKELNGMLEDASFEIVGNPSLIGTEQWQYALQLFRTKSLDSLVRYFASYLPQDHPWHHDGDSTVASSNGYDDILDCDHPFMFDEPEEENSIYPKDPSHSFAAIDATSNQPARSMTVRSEDSGVSVNDRDHDKPHDHHTNEGAFSSLESEPEPDFISESLQDSIPSLREYEGTSQSDGAETPSTSISDLSYVDDLNGKDMMDTIVDDDEFISDSQLHTADPIDSEAPTPKPKPAGSAASSATPFYGMKLTSHHQHGWTPLAPEYYMHSTQPRGLILQSVPLDKCLSDICKMATHEVPEEEKAGVTQDELGISTIPHFPPHHHHHHHHGTLQHTKTEDEIDRIGAIATSPGTTPDSFRYLDEAKVLRKMDLRLIPMLALLYLLSFLDRGNIGNAKIEGLQEDLHMLPYQYNWCLTAFFFTYAAFEVPSNLLLKKLRPSRWLPVIMVAWGTVMTLMGIVRDYRGLLAARLFLGVAEAGLYPGVAYYLTMWYCRHEIQLRQALFFSAASVAGAFSGLLAFAISKMDGVGGLEGWRWIFILEGIATVVAALAAFFLLHDFPETAAFLTEEERAFVVFRLKYQGGGGERRGVGAGMRIAEADAFEWKYVRQAFADWQVWLNVVVYWGIVCPLYGISLFLPTIVKNLGYTSSTAQLMTVPIYVTAAILAVVFAYISDRVGKRSPFIIAFLCIMIIGFAMCISTDPAKNPRVTYGGVFIIACAIYPSFPGNITWLSNNLAGSYKRTAGMAIQIGVGNLGGAMASNFYRQPDSPRYILGHSLELGFICAGVVAAVILNIGYTASNHRREKTLAEGAEDRFGSRELSEMGDKACTFRYMH